MTLPGTQQSSPGGSLNVVLENPAQPKRKRLSYEVPQTEEQWQSCRRACGLATPKDILNKIENLRAWDSRALYPWEKMVVIAATVVDLFTGQEEDTLKFGQVYTGHMSYDTRRRDRAAVLNFIRLLDRLYPNLEHRTFELLAIWNIPLSTIRPWTSRKFDEIYSEFSGNLLEPKKEIQASIPLYIPFLVHFLRPGYSLDTIQEALKTKTLTQSDLKLFQDVCKSRQCVPRLLSTLGDFRIPHCRVEATTSQPSEESLTFNETDAELNSVVRLDMLYPVVLNITIAGYMAFDILPKLQREASRAEKEQNICTRIKKQDTRIVQYDWSDEYHSPTANRAIDDLVRAGILCRQDVFRQKAYLRHRGQLKLESPSLQIIIPTASPREPLFVTLSSSDLSSSRFEDRIAWKANRGLLLEEGTTLSATESVFFISIVLPKPRQQ